MIKNERWSLAMLALMFLLAAASWPFLPDRLPTHYSWNGEADSFGNKSVALLFLVKSEPFDVRTAR